MYSSIRSFESTEREQWPNNALKFTEVLLQSLKDISADPQGPFKPLFELTYVLKELVALRQKYKITITYSKFTQVIQLTYFVFMVSDI